MIIDEYAILKWNGANKQRYIDLGYEFTGIDTEFRVAIKDLSKTSNAIIKIRCDFCGKEFTKQYSAWRMRHQDGDNLDACSCYACRSAKTQLTNMKKYGCNCVFKNEEVKQKIRDKMIELYGAPYNMQIPEIREKFHETMREKYGKDWYSQTDEFGEQYWDTRFKNGNVPVSKVETKMCEILYSMYGDKTCPSYHLDRIVMDCKLELDGYKIDIEYDGQRWHQDREEQDKNRDKFVYSQGYKVLRVKGNFIPPTEDELRNAINYLLSSNSIYIEIIKDWN